MAFSYNQPGFDDSWPDAVKQAYADDLQESYGQIQDRGYVFAYHNRIERVMEQIVKFVPPGSTILDAAAGHGNYSIRLSKLGFRVTWNDIRSELIEYVRMKHEEGELDFIPGNIVDLPVKKEFDCVLACEVIEHTAHPISFLKSLAAHLKPGGVLVVSTPNGAYFRNQAPCFSECKDSSIYEARQFGPGSEDHIFVIHPDEVELLARNSGLEVVLVRFFTNFVSRGWFGFKFLSQALPQRFLILIEKLFAILPHPVKKRLMVAMLIAFSKPE